jgi:hypothetical protein
VRTYIQAYRTSCDDTCRLNYARAHYSQKAVILRTAAAAGPQWLAGTVVSNAVRLFTKRSLRGRTSCPLQRGSTVNNRKISHGYVLKNCI